ncbi:hypothetical protein V5799_008850 [Amblyomma americanum]|uniref:Uncharacterized protein n=1 Tax=Amblyomma americanum TaxID=6943 RepID=A0AAQ4FBV5_AMBAM
MEGFYCHFISNYADLARPLSSAPPESCPLVTDRGGAGIISSIVRIHRGYCTPAAPQPQPPTQGANSDATPSW